MTTVSSPPAWQVLGLSEAEYQRVLEIQGRVPTSTELAMYSVEWSEHCGYPRSRRHLSRLPREGRYAPLVGTDAGGIVVTAGNRSLVIVFKAESHNHPSQVEPKAGAATGIGGIVRDILSMGARPVALLDSLRFGSAHDAGTAWYVRGVTDGIQQYGNCIGVPTVAGEVSFDEAFAGNCLVNVMCVGVLEEGKSLMTSRAPADLSVMFLGSRTGRDGIGGCSILASREFSEDDQKRPTVQIGDPFAGKCLIEATLEAIASGAVVAMKDMGAAGLTCTTSEMAAAGGVGMDIDLVHVPRREEGMEPYELMMSESQERMLAAVTPGREDEVREIYHRWGLQAEVVGRTQVGDRLVIRDEGVVVGDLPVQRLTEPEVIDLPYTVAPPAAAGRITATIAPDEWPSSLLRMVGAPNVASRSWFFRQYDHQVQTNTVLVPGVADAAVIRLPLATPEGAVRGLAVTMDANPRLCALDPYEGARQAVAEAARNVVCVGADPAGVTDCLNFGNPEKPERFGQFVRAIDGLAEACRHLGVPVVSGNVSFYNESPGGAIRPTPTIGMVGVVDDVSRVLTMAFGPERDIVLLGDLAGSLAGSEFQAEILGGLAGDMARLDLEREKALQGLILEAHRQGLLCSAHDLSEGGLLVAVAESCLAGACGASLDLSEAGQGVDLVDLAFGEAPSRVLVSVDATGRERLLEMAHARAVPARLLGATGGGSLRVRMPGLDPWEVPLSDLERAHGGLADMLGV